MRQMPSLWQKAWFVAQGTLPSAPRSASVIPMTRMRRFTFNHHRHSWAGQAFRFAGKDRRKALLSKFETIKIKNDIRSFFNLWYFIFPTTRGARKASGVLTNTRGDTLQCLRNFKRLLLKIYVKSITIFVSLNC